MAIDRDARALFAADAFNASPDARRLQRFFRWMQRLARPREYSPRGVAGAAANDPARRPWRARGTARLRRWRRKWQKKAGHAPPRTRADDRGARGPWWRRAWWRQRTRASWSASR